MELDVEVEDRLEFQQIMRELKDNFASIVKEIEVITIYQIHKFDFLPMYTFP